MPESIDLSKALLPFAPGCKAVWAVYSPESGGYLSLVDETPTFVPLGPDVFYFPSKLTAGTWRDHGSLKCFTVCELQNGNVRLFAKEIR